jgi:hypothetical protein
MRNTGLWYAREAVQRHEAVQQDHHEHDAQHLQVKGGSKLVADDTENSGTQMPRCGAFQGNSCRSLSRQLRAGDDRRTGN